MTIHPPRPKDVEKLDGLNELPITKKRGFEQLDLFDSTNTP